MLKVDKKIKEKFKKVAHSRAKEQEVLDYNLVQSPTQSSPSKGQVIITATFGGGQKFLP